MGLVRVCCPSVHCLESFYFQLAPFALLHHKLPCNLIPSRLPIQPRIQNHNMDFINPYIASNKCKPVPILHGSEFILILYQPIIIEFILIKRPLLIKHHLVVRSEFVERYHILLASLCCKLSL